LALYPSNTLLKTVQKRQNDPRLSGSMLGVIIVKSTDPLIGQTIGGYEVLSKLGAGGMGAVYRARDLELDKIVALKVLLSHAVNDEDSVERFRREARIAAKLEHSNIVTIFRFGSEQGFCYLVMRYIEGESLADRLMSEQRLAIPDALTIVFEVAKGLECAHQAGLVHRDIKPANILLSSRGEVLVADFGLAKQAGAGAGGLTATGMILGTPDYMAPEQCEGFQDVDGRADIYSLGLVFYTMLTGKVPSEGKTPLQIIMNRVRKAVPPPRAQNPEIPVEINDLIVDMLKGDREQRLGNATALLDRIETLQQFQGRGTGRLRSPPPQIGSHDKTVLAGPLIRASIPIKAKLISRAVEPLAEPKSTKTSPNPKVTARAKAIAKVTASPKSKAAIRVSADKSQSQEGAGTPVPSYSDYKASRAGAKFKARERNSEQSRGDTFDDDYESHGTRSHFVILSILVALGAIFLCCIFMAAMGG
jgi:serine/threonine protein kinase